MLKEHETICTLLCGEHPSHLWHGSSYHCSASDAVMCHNWAGLEIPMQISVEFFSMFQTFLRSTGDECLQQKIPGSTPVCRSSPPLKNPTFCTFNFFSPFLLPFFLSFSSSSFNCGLCRSVLDDPHQVRVETLWPVLKLGQLWIGLQHIDSPCWKDSFLPGPKNFTW